MLIKFHELLFEGYFSLREECKELYEVSFVNEIRCSADKKSLNKS